MAGFMTIRVAYTTTSDHSERLPRPMSTSVAQLQPESAMMSVTSITTEGCAAAPGMGWYLKPCWCHQDRTDWGGQHCHLGPWRHLGQGCSEGRCCGPWPHCMHPRTVFMSMVPVPHLPQKAVQKTERWTKTWGHVGVWRSCSHSGD